MSRSMPEYIENDDPVTCPLCHGTGKTTGRILLHFEDAIMGRLLVLLEKASDGLRDTILRRLWDARKAGKE